VSDEWLVVQALVVIVGLFLAVGRPMLKLNGTIVKLDSSVEILNKRFDRFEEENKDSHARIYKKDIDQDETINNHETRIVVLENK